MNTEASTSRLSSPAEVLQQALGIPDPALARVLCAFGFDHTCAPLVVWIPAIEFAWLDGRTGAKQRRLLDLVRERHHALGVRAEARLREWLVRRPPDALFRTARRVLRAQVEALPQTNARPGGPASSARAPTCRTSPQDGSDARRSPTNSMSGCSPSPMTCVHRTNNSVPPAEVSKESAFGCAGIFTAPVALELYAQVFEEEGALDRLEAFASLNGARFYGLSPNTETVTLVQSPWKPETRPAGDQDQVRVFCPDGMVRWRLLGPPD